MGNDKKDAGFGSFQIGNMGGGLPGMGPGMPGMGGAPKAAPAAAPTQAAAGGQEEESNDNYPFLAELIEKEDEAIKVFGEEMAAVYQEIQDLVAKRTGRVKQEAEKALLAYDRTFDAIDYLREIKANLMNPPSED